MEVALFLPSYSSQQIPFRGLGFATVSNGTQKLIHQVVVSVHQESYKQHDLVVGLVQRMTICAVVVIFCVRHQRHDAKHPFILYFLLFILCFRDYRGLVLVEEHFARLCACRRAGAPPSRNGTVARTAASRCNPASRHPGPLRLGGRSLHPAERLHHRHRARNTVAGIPRRARGIPSSDTSRTMGWPTAADTRTTNDHATRTNNTTTTAATSNG